MPACWPARESSRKDEARKIVGGLDIILHEIHEGAFVWKDELEDVHMNIEGQAHRNDRRCRAEAAHGPVEKRSGVPGLQVVRKRQARGLERASGRVG